MRSISKLQPRYLLFLLVVFWSFVCLVLFSRALTSTVSHDEYQFAASAYAFSQRLLLPYRDFPFLHMPYLPVIQGIALFFTNKSFLAARLINSAFELGELLLLFFLVKKIASRGSAGSAILTAMSATLLMLFEPAFTHLSGRALNHALPQSLSLLALFIFFGQGKHSSPYWKPDLLWAGVFLGVATGVRLTYAAIFFPFLLSSIIFPRSVSVSVRLKQTLWFLFGAGTGLLPAIILILTNPMKAYYGNLVYIRLNTLYREGLGFATRMSLGQKFEYFFNYLSGSPIAIAIYVFFMISLLFVLWRWARKYQFPAPDFFLAGGLSLTMLATSFAPTPTWVQYFFPAVPFILVFIYLVVSEWMVYLRRTALLALATAAVIGLGGYGMETLPLLLRPDQWVTTQVKDIGIKMKEKIPTDGGRVLTLAPILPLEAGLEVYPVFIVGPFSWRTAQFLSPERRRQYGVISPDDLELYLQDSPPAAILTGPELNYESFSRFSTDNLESAFSDYALRHGYQPVPIQCRIYLNDCVFWVKQP